VVEGFLLDGVGVDGADVPVRDYVKPSVDVEAGSTVAPMVWLDGTASVADAAARSASLQLLVEPCLFDARVIA
jgi:hypothetical protein